MIDTKELRRLAQAAKNSCESVEWSHEFRSGRYSQGVIISGEENILIVCGANYGCWRDADDDGDSQFKALGDFVAAANPAAVSEFLDRLEAAEKDVAIKEEVIDSLAAVVKRLDAQCDAAEKERDALRASKLPDGLETDLFIVEHAMRMNNWDWNSDTSDDLKRSAYKIISELLAAQEDKS